MKALGGWLSALGLLLLLCSCSSWNKQATLEKAWKQVLASTNSRQEALAVSRFDDAIEDCNGVLRVNVQLENGRQLDLNTVDDDSSQIDSFNLRVAYKGGTFQTGRWQPKQLANVYILLLE